MQSTPSRKSSSTASGRSVGSAASAAAIVFARVRRTAGRARLVEQMLDQLGIAGVVLDQQQPLAVVGVDLHASVTIAQPAARYGGWRRK